jgi:hypothetical protein
MRINAIEIDGDMGLVAITRTETGAAITLGAGGTGDGAFLVCEIGRDESRDARYAKARTVAGAVYGTTRGKPNATNSMVHDVMNEIDRVAGC